MALWPDLADGRGQQPHALAQPVRGRRRVADHQAGRAGAQAVVRQRLHRDAGHQGALGDVRVVDTVREADEQVQPGRHAVHAGIGQVLAQGGEQRVAPGALAGADPAQVPLEGARRQQLGEGELAEGGAGDVRPLLAHHQLLPHVRRGDHPAQPQRRGQRLRHAAQVDDVLGGERRERGHRRAVVAVLGVVVVLDDEAAVPGPVQEGAAARRGEHDAGRVLVRGCREDGAHPGPGEGVDVAAEVVHRDGGERESPSRSSWSRVPREPGSS